MALSEKHNTPNMSIEIGTKVERIASDYTNGRKGEVVEIKGDRARVAWESSPRTWVNFRFLKVLTGIRKGEWIQTPRMQSYTAFRVCENPATGETWHEYQGKRKFCKGQWI